MAQQSKIGADFAKRWVETGRLELAEAFGHMFPGQNAIAKGIEAVRPPLDNEKGHEPPERQGPDFTP